MNDYVIYWIVIGCLSLSAIKSVVDYFILMRNSDSAEKTNSLWCGLVNTICLYGTFITLYANRWFSHIYDYLYYQYDYYTTECLFLLTIMLILIATVIPSSVLNILTNKNLWSATKEELLDMLLILPCALLFGGYIMLLVHGLLLAMIPVLIAVIGVGMMIYDSVFKRAKVFPVKLLLWLFSISVAVIGLTLVVYYLINSYVLSAAMDITTISYVANLLSVIFISLPLVDIIESLYKHFEPRLYISTIHDDN